MSGGLVGATIVVRDNSSAVLAAVSAASGILGAAIGGLTAGRFALKGEDKRQAFDRDRNDERNKREDQAYLTQVRGAGRVLAGQLRSVEQAVRLSRQTNQWWPRGMVAVPSLSLDDLKLLAGFLQANDWTTVDGAIAMCERVIMRRDWEPDGQPALDATTPPLHEGDIGLLEAAHETLLMAMRNLQTVG